LTVGKARPFWQQIVLALLGVGVLMLPEFLPGLAAKSWPDMVGLGMVATAGIHAAGILQGQAREAKRRASVAPPDMGGSDA